MDNNKDLPEAGLNKLLNSTKQISQKTVSKIFGTDYTVFIFYAVVIGAVVGFATVLFHNSIELLNKEIFEQSKEGLYFLGAAVVILFPAIGMLIQSIMIITKPDYAKRRGVSEVIKAVASRGGKIPLRITLFHFIAPVICIGTGNTVGPEGPAAQLGGGIANKLAHVFKLSDSRKRILTAAGAGAAIAAIFNTPMGGIFFAIEIVLLNEFETATFSALILSSVTASAISRIFLGNDSIFIFHSPSVGGYQTFYVYALLGLFAGFISLLYIRYSNSLDEFLHDKILSRMPQWVVMTAIGLLVGVSGYFFSDIFGIGYIGINHILASSLAWKTVLILLALKFILVPLVLNSGGFGGIFAPSLFIGACVGFLFGTGLNYFFGFNFDVTAFILVGMGAILGGINSVPIASILIIFEMTKDYSFILPLMLAVVTSSMIVQITLKRSIHEHHLEKQGYRIASKGDIRILQSVKVAQVMKESAVLIPEETPLPLLIKSLTESTHSTFYTIDKDNKLKGTITEGEMRPIITEYEHIREVLVARDIASPNVVTVNEDDNLDYVMKLFEKKDADEFPVKNRQNGKVIGVINRHDVISAYNRETLRENVPEALSYELEKISTKRKTTVFEGFSVAEIKSPKKFIGKTIASLGVRKNYGLTVLMIRRSRSPYEETDSTSELIMPEPDYVIHEDDVLLLFGSDDKIEAMDKQENK